MIADKSPVVRAGLRDFISRDGRFEVLDTQRERGLPSSPRVEQHPTDIGIIGWSLPDMNGGEVLCDLEAPAHPDAHHRLYRRARQRRAAPGGAPRRLGLHLEKRRALGAGRQHRRRSRAGACRCPTSICRR